MPRIVHIHEGTISLKSEIRNAWISFADMDASLVALVSDVVRDGQPVVGYGFNSNGRYAPQGVLQSRLLPRLQRAEPEALLDDTGENFDPHRIREIVMQNEKPGGHGERAVAVAVLDMAVYDLIAKIEGKPLHRLIADRYTREPPEPDVFVYAAGGYYYPNGDLTTLQDEMRRYLDLGYRVVKMKIGGAALNDDLARIEAVIEVVDGEGGRVAVDANGRFDRQRALEYAEALEPYGLFWYEEPGDPLDFELHAEVSNAYGRPLATGENLFSMQDVRNLIRYGGMRPERDYLQFDPALSYGLVEYLQTLEMVAAAGWSARRCIPHGGHQFALHMAAGLRLGGNESYPGLFEPIGGFADNIPVLEGRVTLGEDPGIGIENKAALHAAFRAIVD